MGATELAGRLPVHEREVEVAFPDHPQLLDAACLGEVHGGVRHVGLEVGQDAE
jgi:hypothetical protein